MKEIIFPNPHEEKNNKDESKTHIPDIEFQSFNDLFNSIDLSQMDSEKTQKKLIIVMQTKIVKLEADLSKQKKIHQDLESQNKKLTNQISSFVIEKDTFSKVYLFQLQFYIYFSIDKR